MKLAILTSLLVLTSGVFAQNLSLGTDTTVCQGANLDIVTTGVDPANVIQLTGGTSLTLADDQYSGVIPIGFNFQFYGNTFSNLLIGMNGVITFNLSQANGYCPWSGAGTPIPNGSAMFTNTIYACFMDFAGTNAVTKVVYEMTGTAPNRRMVILYKNLVVMGGCPNSCNSLAVILHETSNEIDIYIHNKPVCGYGNGGAIQAVQNGMGNMAYIVPGTTSVPWIADLYARKLVPAGPNYTVDTLPAFALVTDEIYSVVWANTASPATLAYNDTLNLPSVTASKGYFLAATTPGLCATSIVPLSDTSWINVNPAEPLHLSQASDFCNSGNGTVFSTDSTSADGDYYWTSLSVNADTLTGLMAGSYGYIFTGNNGCQTAGSISVLNSNSGTSQHTNVTCASDSTGTITILPDLPGITYSWPALPGNTTNVATNLPPGTYDCYITSTYGCSDTVTATIAATSNLQFLTETATGETCIGGADGTFTYTFTGTSSPFQALLDVDSIVGSPVTGLAAGTHELVIIDANGCQFSTTFTIDPGSMIIVSPGVTPEINGNDGMVTIAASGGAEPYFYSIGQAFQASNEFTGLAAGTYTSIVKDNNQCSSTPHNFTISSVLGIAENDLSETVYPNPFNETLTLHLHAGMYTVMLEDAAGRCHIRTETAGNGTIDTKALKPGIYFLRIEQNGTMVQSGKVIRM